MSDATTQFLEHLTDAFMDNDFAAVAEHYAYPLPYYANDDILVFGAKQSLIEAMNLYRIAVQEAGITRITPRIVAQGLPLRGYKNIWIEFDHFDADGTCLRTNQARYLVFQKEASAFPLIEMVDFTVADYPELALLTNTTEIAQSVIN